MVVWVLTVIKMPGNYLERLRFALIIASSSPASISINCEEDTGDYSIVPGINTCIFDCTIYTQGIHELCLSIREQTAEIKIEDIRVHGLSVAGRIYDCVYTTRDGVHKPNVCTLGELGTWCWRFATPVHESESWRIGLV
jgi:hypothetical protein